MSVKLTYTNKYGTEKQVEFEKDIEEMRLILLDTIVDIDLTPLRSCLNLQKLDLYYNKLKSIDLSPLSSCTELKTLHLGYNPLQSIDLSPLSSCSELMELSIPMCKLESIDLSPFSSCTNFKTLDLIGNKLKSIDLSPLSSCTELKTLRLDYNPLQSIDLSPLSSCKKLRYLALYGNTLKSIDLYPLSSCRNLRDLHLTALSNRFKVLDITPLSTAACNELYENFTKDDKSFPANCSVISWLNRLGAEYDRPSLSNNWSFLIQVAKRRISNQRVQQDILYALGLADYGFIDSNLKDLFLSIPPETPIDEVRERVANVLVSEIVKSVDKGGATTGFKLDEMIAKHEELAAKEKQIIELRNHEIQTVQVKLEIGGVDLRELWLTAYGWEILSTLNTTLDESLGRLESVKRSLKKLGWELRTGETSSSGVKMSKRLKESIWWIVEHRGREWWSIA